MKLKVGDYVRTIGGIERLKKENDNGWFFEKNMIIKPDNIEKYIIKSSHNIIDLIEVGDYVNGKKVIDKQYHYTDKDNYDMGEWCIFYENEALGNYQKEIQSIVTKEQFSAMEYRLGDK